jgi:hypothetical protein
MWEVVTSVMVSRLVLNLRAAQADTQVVFWQGKTGQLGVATSDSDYNNSVGGFAAVPGTSRRSGLDLEDQVWTILPRPKPGILQ